MLHPDAEASVELIAKASHAAESAHVAEVTLVSNGHVLRSTSAGATPIAAFDVVLDKLERQVVRSKERPRSVRERHSDEVESVLNREALGTIEPDGAAAGADGRPSVVKIKRFNMQPLFEEDAITQMEELGHAFFVFLNAESEQVAVLYKRTGWVVRADRAGHRQREIALRRRLPVRGWPAGSSAPPRSRSATRRTRAGRRSGGRSPAAAVPLSWPAP